MKFLHTADWQIGMKAGHVGEAAERVRDERLCAVERVVEAARANGAEFILVAGDLFEDNGVDRVQVLKTADRLRGFDGPVFIIPGNHDPWTPGSVWEHPAWKSSSNIRVLREEAPVELDGGVLYPCPVKEKHSGKDPTVWIQPQEGKGIRIGLAHGTVEGTPVEELDYPIARDAAERAGLDYLALGHWHSTAFYERMAYSGTHETTKFGERDSGNVLIVQIPEAGAKPEITTVHTGGLTWKTFEEEVRGGGDLVRFREMIESLKDGDTRLVEVRLTGLLAPEDRGELRRIDEILRARFLYAQLDTSQLRPSPKDGNWLAGLPAGVVHETAARLQSFFDPESAAPRPDWATAELARRALLELHAIIGEVSQ